MPAGKAAARPPRPTIGSLEALRGYLGGSGGAGRTAAGAAGLRALFLDRDNRLLRDEPVDPRREADRTPPSSSPRGPVRRAVEAGAAAVILVRHRPDDGDTEPTAADLEDARRAYTALAALEVVLHDYVIVAGGRCTSLRGADLLRGPHRVTGLGAARQPSAHGQPG